MRVVLQCEKHTPNEKHKHLAPFLSKILKNSCSKIEFGTINLSLLLLVVCMLSKRSITACHEWPAVMVLGSSENFSMLCGMGDAPIS